jgi:adenylyltransferase/sulfurtransferase
VPSCEEGGVLGVLPGIVGSLQAVEALKLVLGAGEALVGRLLLVDALGARFRELTLAKDPDCPLCGAKPEITRLMDYEAFCGVAPAAPSRKDERAMELTALELKDELAGGGKLVLLDVREDWEYEICHVQGSILVPLGTLPERIGELSPGSSVVTICHTGSRSRQAALYLRANGFADARSLKGGVEGWAVHVEPGMARY